jgi:integrase
MFANQGWEIPSGLASDSRPKEELTFWKACELFLKYPDVRKHPSRWRHEISLSHIVDKLGKDRPLKSLWVPDLRAYQAERINEGAAPGTINRELSTLSRLFGVMVELQLTETNPVRLVKRLSMRSGERQVYLSPHTVKAIAPRCPAWFRPILWAGYYTGMRRGEILGLTRKQANLSKRIISLGPDDTKEGHWKRVPIHSELAPILAEVLNGPALISGKVFPLRDGDGVRELGLETFKNPWERACKALGLDKPWPRFHDLRHTWRTNARRSGVDPQIAESIMGHWFKGRSVNDRYGRISDQELLDAIDRMTFDHGETEIFVARGRDVADRGKM